MEELDNIGKFNNCLQIMLIKMQEADNSCIEITKDLTKREFSVVIFVGKRNNEVIMKDIADYLSIPMSTTTGVVDKMVEKGYLKRVYSKEDRRAIKIALSKYGLDCFNLLESILRHMSGAMLAGLSEKEETTLIDLLTKLTDNLKDYIPLNQVTFKN